MGRLEHPKLGELCHVNVGELPPPSEEFGRALRARIVDGYMTYVDDSVKTPI